MASAMQQRLFLNEDPDHFVYSRSTEDLTEKGVDALVDGYAQGTQVSDLVFNPNASKSVIPSKVKQLYWEGYDPKKGNDQPYFAGTTSGVEEIRRVLDNFLLLQERGIDLFDRWLKRSRALGRRAWLSVRMNDCHNVEDSDHMAHDPLWRKHSEYWRVPWREFEWPADRTLVYSYPEVRDHHVNYAKECIERYEIDGLEIDWMRQPWCFRPGREREGLEISEGVMAELRRALDARGKKLGHPIQLSARVPGSPERARGFGFDAVSWARKGLVDVVIPSSDFGTTEFDMPVEVWQQLLEGTKAKLFAGLEITLTPFPFAPFGVQTVETARGAAAGLLDRGADGIYLFNYMDAPKSHPLGVGGLETMLRELGSIDTMAGKSRRHVITYPSPRVPGMGYPGPLPYRLGNSGFRPTAEFRVPIGPAPQRGEAAFVRLGLEADSTEGAGAGRTVNAFGRGVSVGTGPADPKVARELVVRIDGVTCAFAGEIAPTKQTLPPEFRAAEMAFGPTHAYRIPEGTLRRGDNVIEVSNRNEKAVSVVWVEVGIL